MAIFAYRNRVRLDRYLHESGAGSRREVNLLIRAGRVMVNGAPAGDGAAHVLSGARVELDGRVVAPLSATIVIFNKPPGYVTSTRDEQAVIYDILPFRPEQLLPVGRLDKDSEGLLLLTSDGQLLYRLTSPKWHVEKEYIVELRDPLESRALELLRTALDIGRGEIIRPPVLVEPLGEKIVKIILDEGKYHQIRRMAAVVGNHVTKLTRVRVGPVLLGSLGIGEWRNITDTEEKELRAALAARHNILKKEKMERS